MLDLVYTNETGNSEWSEKFFRSILESAAQDQNLSSKKVEVGLYLITPERSQELNLKYRHKDKPTDVLSFPLDERGLATYGILPLGDIFICLEVATKQAQELSLPLNQELARLAVHGFLHLLGYDHETGPADEKKMVNIQERILQTLKF